MVYDSYVEKQAIFDKKMLAEPVEATIFNFQPIKLLVYDT